MPARPPTPPNPLPPPRSPHLSRLLSTAALTTLLAATAACHGPAVPANIPAGAHSPFTGYQSARYDEPRMWLCRPDAPSDACRVDLTETELRADGSRAIVPHALPKTTDVDCFSVNTTVDVGVMPANHEDFDDRERVKKVAAWQAAVAELGAPRPGRRARARRRSWCSWPSRRRGANRSSRMARYDQPSQVAMYVT